MADIKVGFRVRVVSLAPGMADELSHRYVGNEYVVTRTDRTWISLHGGGGYIWLPHNLEVIEVPDHEHNFANPLETCECGITAMEFVVRRVAERIAAARPTCTCGQERPGRALLRGLCGDCFASLKKSKPEDLDSRIRAARVEPDPASDWSAWSTPHGEGP